jgi:hypothetical protein
LQTVEVAIVSKDDLREGEYRSHLNVRTEVKRTAGYVITVDGHGVTASLMPSLAITIPVIIRVGDMNVDVAISGMAFARTEHGPKLEFVLNRMGSMSVYGDIAVDHVSVDMTITRVGVVRGVAVYTPNASRVMTVKLNEKKQVDYQNGCLRVSYLENDGANIPITEAELMLTPKPPGSIRLIK